MPVRVCLLPPQSADTWQWTWQVTVYRLTGPLGLSTRWWSMWWTSAELLTVCDFREHFHPCDYSTVGLLQRKPPPSAVSDEILSSPV